MEPFEHMQDIETLSGREFETRCRQLCMFANLGDNIGLCRVLSKFKAFVDTRDTSIAPHLIMDGFWETWLSQCLASIVKPGDICIDIGANFGYFSLLMSALSEGGGRTIAVEPNPALAALLRRTGGSNSPGFSVAEAALSDSGGTITLHIPTDSYGDASIIERSDRKSSSSTSVEVRSITLDDLLVEMNITRVDVIKIDVEGVEPQVFAGMRKTIAANPDLKIIIEYSPFLYSNPRAFTEYLFANFAVNRIKDVPVMEKLDESAIELLLNLTDHTDLYLSRKMQETQLTEDGSV